MIALQQIFVAVMSSPSRCCFSRESSVSKHSVRLPCERDHTPTGFVSAQDERKLSRTALAALQCSCHLTGCSHDAQ